MLDCRPWRMQAVSGLMESMVTATACEVTDGVPASAAEGMGGQRDQLVATSEGPR